MKDNKSMVVEYNFQKMPEKVVVWSDTDLAGCKCTRRSTSGGVVMFGNHCIKTDSQTQETIALSSGESEFYGIVKAAAMSLGIKGLRTCSKEYKCKERCWASTTHQSAGAVGARPSGERRA